MFSEKMPTVDDLSYGDRKDMAEALTTTGTLLILASLSLGFVATIFVGVVVIAFLDEGLSAEFVSKVNGMDSVTTFLVCSGASISVGLVFIAAGLAEYMSPEGG